MGGYAYVLLTFFRGESIPQSQITLPRPHGVMMLSIGQYLMPSGDHFPVRRYVHPDVFKMFETETYKMGFAHAAVGAMVRSSYHADMQAHGAGVNVNGQQAVRIISRIIF